MSNPPPPGPPPGWEPQGQPDRPGQPGPPGPPPGQAWEQGGFGQGPGQPWGQPVPEPSGQSKVPFIIGGAVLVVAVVTVVLLLALRGGGSSSSSPEATVNDFIAAARSHDCEKAYALLSADLQQQEGSCKTSEDVVPPSDIDVTFGDVTISGETDTQAVATVDAKFSGQSFPLTIQLVKENGDWKIDNLN